MTSRFERVQELVLGATEQPPDTRRAWLVDACGDDADLLREVESLLAHADSEDPRLQTGGVLAWDDTSSPPERIGPFTLQEKLGEGGFG